MEIILDNDKYIKNVIKNIKVYNNKQNEKFNFVPLNRLKKKKISEYGSITEGNLLDKRLNKMNKIKNTKNRKLKKEVEKDIDLINDNIINYSDGANNKSWKLLNSETKLEKFEEYIKNYDIVLTDILKNNIIELIKNNKVDYRKYIVYDKINERIEEMPLIKLNNDTNSYYLLTDTENKSRKSHRKKISKIFKIK